MTLIDRAVIALVGLTFFHGVADAQESRPCKVIRTVVETERSILLLCDESSPSLPALAELHIAKKGAPGEPRVELEKVTDVKVEDVPEGAPQWKRVVIPASGTALTPGNRYFVYVPPSAPPQLPSGTAWRPFWQEIKTEFEATITDSAASIDSGAKLTLTAGVALQPGDGVTLHATTDGQQCQVPAIFAVSRPAPIGPGADPDMIGRVEIVVTGTRLPTGKVKLTVNGLKDLLGTPVNTAAKARTEILGRKLSGKTKDEVGTYIKLGHQAGRNTEPVWTVDSKIAVELPRRFDDWRVTPTATVDIGFGPSKSSNTTKMGVAFTRFDLVGGTDFNYPRESWSEREASLQGVGLTVAPTFETDRDFEKRNVLVDLDGEFFFDGFYNPIQRQNRRRLDEARQKTPGIEMDEVAGASFGWAITTNLGVEVGRSLDDRKKTIETGMGDETVETTLVAEAHSIFRLRPRLGVLLEFKRFSFNLQGTGRFLVSDEQALVEADKTFSVQKFEGWHGYGEVTLSVPLSPRTAIDSTWKNGRQPPQFQRLNVVQTGLAFRF